MTLYEILRCMFGIVVLHESVMVWKFFLYQWQECFVQDVTKEKAVHYSIKDTKLMPLLPLLLS